MRIISLHIEKFKGIDDLFLELNGENMDAYGTNATGKTSIFDSFVWLLFGKDSSGKVSFDIKPKDEDGNVRDRRAITSVTAVIEHKAEMIELKKCYYEKWVQRRGSAEREPSGNTVDHFIDEKPVKSGEYSEYINSICSADIFAILTDPWHACAKMHWKDLRDILFEVAGSDLSDAVIINSDSELELLGEMKGKHNVKDFLEILKSRQKTLKKKLDAAPPAIQELLRQAKEYEHLDAEAIRRASMKAHGDLSEAEKEYRQIRDDTMISNTKLKLDQSKNAIDQLVLDNRNWHLEQRREWDNTQREKAGNENNKLFGLQGRLREIQAGLNENQSESEKLSSRLTALRDEWAAINASVWDGDEICPSCGQIIPPDALATSKDLFNLQKSKKLEENVSSGKAIKEILEGLKSEKDKLAAELAGTQSQIKEVNALLAIINREEFSPVDMVAYEFTYEKLSKDIETLEKQLSDEQQGIKQSIEPLQNRMKEAKDEIAQQEANFLLLGQREKIMKRIDEIKLEQSEVIKSLEEIEHGIYLCELFMRRKIEMASLSINSLFQITKFQLFETLGNGEETETCIPTLKGVSWGSANTAGKINVGLDIINVLSRYYQFSAPIFIDGAESIVDFIDTEAQMIRLIVSKEHKSLYIPNQNIVRGAAV